MAMTLDQSVTCIALAQGIGQFEYHTGHDYMHTRMLNIVARILAGEFNTVEDVGCAIADQYLEHIDRHYKPDEESQSEPPRLL